MSMALTMLCVPKSLQGTEVVRNGAGTSPHRTEGKHIGGVNCLLLHHVILTDKQVPLSCTKLAGMLMPMVPSGTFSYLEDEHTLFNFYS